MDKELDGIVRQSMKTVAKHELMVSGNDEVTVGVVYDGYTPDGTIMKLEVCEPGFDESRYWTWKTFKK